jgi:hypothetical protein
MEALHCHDELALAAVTWVARNLVLEAKICQCPRCVIANRD